MGREIGRGDVEDSEAGLAEVLGGVGNLPRVMVIGILSGDKISIVMLFAMSLAMASGVSWGDNHQETRDSAIPVDAFTGVDCRLFLLVDIALVV